MIFNCTGFTHSKGVAKTSGKPYNMARLFRLAEIKPWKNDNGEGRSAGYQTDDRTSFDVFVGDDKLINQLLLINYPANLDLQFEPHPEDPTRNVVTAFSVVEPGDEI